jgi:lipoprotein-anchoring transpeptidase ErfK/SrfK
MRTSLIGVGAALTLVTAAFVAHPARGEATPLPTASPGAPAAIRPVANRTAPHRTVTVSTVSRSIALDAALTHDVPVFGRPGGRKRVELSTYDALGSRRVLLVVARRGPRWLEVRLPLRPNGVTGWVRTRSVELRRNRWRAVVSLSKRRLTLLHDGTVVRRYTVGVGAGATPTPTGLYAVTDRILTGDPSGAYGPVAFGLSGFSDVIHRFNGGPGQIAIHGTNESWTIGQAASLGCVHVSDSTIMSLYPDLQLGTPVLIRR